MSKPKRHHFVPQMLLRRFADESGRLYFFNKRFPQKGVLPTSPTNLYVEGDLYTFLGSDGAKDVSLEAAFATIEKEADAIVENIVSSARRGTVPRLTPREKARWDLYFYMQWRRVPDMHNSALSHAEFEQMVQSELDLFEKTVRPLAAGEREQYNDPDVLARLRHNARVQALASPGAEAISILSAKGIAVLRVLKPRKSFVIGSHPVVKLTYPGRSHLSDPTVEVWFPIAHDVAISPMFSSGVERLIELHEPRHVRGINEAIFRQSTAIAGRSPKLVASLAGVDRR